MATVQTTQTDYLDQISGAKPIQDPLAKTYGGDTTTGPSGGAGTPSAPTTVGQNIFSAPDAVRPQVTSETYNRLFAPVQQQVERGEKTLAGAQQTFREQAGPSRTYEGIGAEKTLESAISGQQPSAFEASKALVGARYGGPAGLDIASQQELARTGEQLQARLPTLGKTSGVQDLVRAANRRLTPGEALFESQRLAQAPGFRSQAQQLQGSIQGLFQGTQTAAQRAEEFAQQREQEEADIARRRRAFVGGRGEEVSGALDAAVQQAQATERARQEAVGAFQADATEANLAKLNELGAGIDPSLFFTPEAAQAREGETVKQGIMENPQFASIKDVPLMELTVTEHGREGLRIPRAWWKENTKGMSKKEKANLKELAKERQMALERAGFTPGSAASINPKSQRQAAAKQAGEYSLYDPLYFGSEMGAFKPVDAGTYVNFQPGMEATRESIATPEQRARYNVIRSLLGDEAGQLMEADPYTESVVGSEAGRYKEEQTKELESRRKALEASVAKEKKILKKARKQVRGNRLAKALGKTLGSKVLGSTFAGIAQGDPRAVANLPFAMAAAPVDTGTQSDISQSASLVKNPAPPEQKGKKVG